MKNSILEIAPATTKKKSIFDNKIFISVLIMGMIEPGYIAAARFVGGIANMIHLLYIALLCLDVLLIVLLLFIGKVRISACTVFVALFQVVSILSNAINGIFSELHITRACAAIGLILLIEIFLKRNKMQNLLNVLTAWLGLYIVINLLTIIIFPKGMYVDERGWTDNFFLGYRNRHIYTYLPFLACKAVCDYSKKERFGGGFYLMTALILVSCVLANSVTSAICMTVFALCVILFGNFHRPKFINAMTGFAISIVLTVAMIGFNFQTYFTDIFETLFQRNATFTGRTVIWATTLTAIVQNWLLGNGDSVIDYRTSWNVTQAHNKYLDVLYIGGIVLGVIFLIILFIVSKRLMRARGAAANILNYVMICYAVLFLMESYRGDLLIYPLFAISYHIYDLERTHSISRGKQSKSPRFVIRHGS